LKAYHEQKLEHINVETDEAIKEKKEEYARQLDEIEALLSRKVEFANQEADDFRQLSKDELEREVAVLKQKQEDEIARLIESRSVHHTTSHRIVQIATWPLTRCPLFPTSPRCRCHRSAVLKTCSKEKLEEIQNLYQVQVQIGEDSFQRKKAIEQTLLQVGPLFSPYLAPI
jgi:hypothetical protein